MKSMNSITCRASFSALPDTTKRFLRDCRTVVTRSTPQGAIRGLVRLGFTVGGNKNGHYRLEHPLLGSAKITFGSSPSDVRYPLAFTRELRHAAINAMMRGGAI